MQTAAQARSAPAAFSGRCSDGGAGGCRGSAPRRSAALAAPPRAARRPLRAPRAAAPSGGRGVTVSGDRRSQAPPAAAAGGSRRASGASGDASGSAAPVDDDDSYTIRVQTRVYASAAQVWRVLTDQARWADTVPSVVRFPETPKGNRSRRERCTELGSTLTLRFAYGLQVRNQKLRLQGGPGVTVVRQRVAHSAPLWFCAASATVELREERPSRAGARTLAFAEAEGASPAGRLEGAWRVADVEQSEGGAGGPPRCTLSYEATLLPRPGAASARLPPDAARRLLAEGASGAMRGVAAAAERAAAAVAGPAWLEARQLPPPAASAAAASAAASGTSAPSAGDANDFGPREMWGAAALPRSQWAAPDFLGVGDVPLPNSEAQPAASESPVAAEEEGTPGLPALREVHLRRLDNDAELRRRAVATIRVAAPVEFAWAALTDWERHGEFMPGVAAAQLLPGERPRRGRPRLDAPRPRTGRRLRYMVARCSAYVAAHGLLTLDLLEKEHPDRQSSSPSADADDEGDDEAGAQRREVQFRAVPEPGEPRMRGKWLIYPEADDDDDTEALFAAAASATSSSEDGRVARALRGSLLKLAVEVLAPRVEEAVAGGRDPLGERSVYEGLPAMLTAVARRAEALWAAARAPDEASLQLADAAAAAARAITLTLPMPKLVAATELAANPEALRAQLLALGFGADGVMPSRQQLRQLSSGSSGVEAAIVATGGFAAAAALLGWRLGYKPRKPRGYWDRLENVRREVAAFIAERGLEPGVMPSKGVFEAAGRTDLARLAERWGGTASLTEELGLIPARSADSAAVGVRRWNAHVAATRAATGLSLRSNAEELLELASATYVPLARLPGLAPEALVVDEDDDDSEDGEEQPAAPAFRPANSLWLQDWRRPQAGREGNVDGAEERAVAPDAA